MRGASRMSDRDQVLVELGRFVSRLPRRDKLLAAAALGRFFDRHYTADAGPDIGDPRVYLAPLDYRLQLVDVVLEAVVDPVEPPPDELGWHVVAILGSMGGQIRQFSVCPSCWASGYTYQSDAVTRVDDGALDGVQCFKCKRIKGGA